ncbi:MAG: DUF2764 family protein [Candidatus Omnitrophota bacterium]
MSAHYYYLAASLPMLEFGLMPPISYEDFLVRCKEQFSDSDMRIIERSTIEPPKTTQDNFAFLQEWKEFDLALRNELVWLRAAKKGKDALSYIRAEEYRNPFTGYFAQQVYNQDSVLEAERLLDRIRWEKIEDLKVGHFFDIEFLASYALELQILERWKKINQEEGVNILEELSGKL